MKEDSVLNILMYIFKHHMQQGETIGALEEVIDELEQIGFSKLAIHDAFAWLDRLADELLVGMTAPRCQSMRVFSGEERARFTTAAQDYVYYLDQADILNHTNREAVMNLLLDLQVDVVDVSLVQWVTLMVLYNQQDQQQALAKMEFLVLHERAEAVH